MIKKTEKVLIIGGSGSGKDYLMRNLAEKGLKPCIKWTTRPLRKLEQEGMDYHFVTDDYFKESIKNNLFFSYQEFTVMSEKSENTKWFYGISKDEFKKSQIFIITPSELKMIPIQERKKCFIVYLDIDRSIRESRILKREDKNDSIIRRLDADDIDFKSFTDYDLRITDPEFTPDDVFSFIQ